MCGLYGGMTRSMPLRLSALPLLLVCWSAPGFAQTAPTPAAMPEADIRRLTDEERLKILDGNTIESAALARGEAPESEVATRGIHGEVGAAIGTGGMRSLYGTAAIPLGDNAGAVVSFESSRYGYRR